MNRTINLRALLLFAMTMVSFLIFGQYQGPGVSDKIYTVKEVKANAIQLDRSDALVKVKGFITKQINGEDYEFKDSTGILRVEIDKKRMPQKPFDETTELIIIGEVDYDILRPVELDVKQIIFVNE